MNIVKSGEVPKEYDFCKRCGRKLKNPDARKLGYGAVCFKKMQSGGKKLFADIVNDHSYRKSDV